MAERDTFARFRKDPNGADKVVDEFFAQADVAKDGCAAHMPAAMEFARPTTQAPRSQHSVRPAC